MFKKTGGKGPGDCQSKEQCEAFCNDPANQEACFKFAEEHGMIPAEKVQEMKQGMPTGMPTGGMPSGGMMVGPGGCKSMEECTAYCSDPAHLEECQRFRGRVAPPSELVPQEGMKPPEGMMPPSRMAPPEEMMPRKIPTKGMMEKMMPQGMKPPEGMMPPQGMMPPEDINIPQPPANIQPMQQPAQPYITPPSQ